MDLSDKIFIVFWIIQFVKVIGMITGFLTRREILSLSVVTSGLGLLATVIWAVLDMSAFGEIMIAVWSFLFWIDYKVWKKHKDDDDDEHRKKRWAGVRNKLPKPKTKAIPQPI
jgi:hypothetical protein